MMLAAKCYFQLFCGRGFSTCLYWFHRRWNDQKQDVINSCRPKSRNQNLHSATCFAFRVTMDRSTTVLLRDLEDDHKLREIQELPLSVFRQFSSKSNGNRARSSTSILRRSISDSVERNLCHRVGLHQVL